MGRFWRHNISIPYGAIFLKGLSALLCLFLTTSCVEGDNATDTLFGDGTDEVDVPVPTDRTVKITLPAANGESVGYLAHVEGNCNPAGGTITFSGSGSGTTLCGLGGTFAADIDVSGAGVGTVTVRAVLTDSTGNSSAVSVRTFVKTSTACDTLAARTDTYANSSTGGDGGATPWQICTPDQFGNIRLNPSHNFQLENDINFEDTPFTAINPQFDGEVDGQGYTVRNTTITSTGDNFGIFRYVRGPGYIHDINFDNIDVSGRHRLGVVVGWTREHLTDTVRIENINISNSTVSGSNYLGLAIGMHGRDNDASRPTFSVVDNITVTDSEVNGVSYIGGVIGYVVQTQGSYSGSNLTFTDGSVTGSGSYVAGVIGAILESSANVSSGYHATGEVSVTGSTDYIAGVVGRIVGGTNSNFTSTASVTANGTGRSYAGGLMGYLEGGTFTAPCTHVGTINASDIRYSGGLIGYVNDNIVIDGCSVDADVSGRDYSGGIIGRLDPGADLLNTSATPATPKTMTGAGSYIGGAVGYAHNNAIINNVDVNLEVVNTGAYTGGAIGYTGTGVDIDDVHATGNVTSLNRGGGLVGYLNNNGRLDMSTATGDVTTTGGGRCGGLVAELRQSAYITDASAEGDVDCFGGYAGGLVGYTYRTPRVIRTYAVGNVDADGDYAGGLIGGSTENHLLITDSFAVGDVTSTGRYVGGLVGYIRANGTENFKNNFVLGDVVGDRDVGGIAGYYRRNSNNSMKQMYTLGQVTKPIGATGGDATFGAIVGNSNDLAAPYGMVDATLLYVAGMDVYDEASAGSLGGQNTFGTAKSNADLQDDTTYPGAFDFGTPEWEMPLGGFVLPGTSILYTYPVQDWQQ